VRRVERRLVAVANDLASSASSFASQKRSSMRPARGKERARRQRRRDSSERRRARRWPTLPLATAGGGARKSCLHLLYLYIENDAAELPGCLRAGAGSFFKSSQTLAIAVSCIESRLFRATGNAARKKKGSGAVGVVVVTLNAHEAEPSPSQRSSSKSC
jgi:hypothetical protein